MSAAGAAFVNGTAAHGEDFDDTFEGGPVHAGAVIVPAVLAACERHRPDGAAALLGIAVGTETMCRLSTVVPKAVHKAGFHPTAIFGVMGAAAGVGAALGLNAKQIVDALGIAGSFASGIIEYLAEGAWTKRLHPGWAAQSGLRAALLARGGFLGPRTVFEGVHGLFHGFAHTTRRRLRRADGDFGSALGDRDARLQALSVRHHGASLHRLRPAAGGARHQGRPTSRKWSAKWRKAPCTGCGSRLRPSSARPTAMPRNSPRPSFSPPASCAAASGSMPSPTRRCAIAAVLALAAKVRYVIDPDNPYPNEFTGHIRAVLNDGSVVEERQPHFRGGAHEPLTRADIEEKFALNARHGGWDDKRSGAALKLLARLYDGKIDLAPLRG